MKIQIYYDQENREIKDYYKRFIQRLNKNNNVKNIKIKNKRGNMNLYVIIITNHIQKYKAKIDKIQANNKNNKIYIITASLDTANIMECIHITQHISYIKSPIEKTIRRIRTLIEIGN